MTARRLIAALALSAAAVAAGASAQEGRFSQGSQAAEWGLLGEEKARFEGRVVDVLCELTGDCPADCGAGRRQLGILRAADGALVLAVKNGQPIFTGAGQDLLPYCGAEIEADGLLVGDDEANPAKLFQLQFIRRKGEPAFVRADRWTRVWNETHPEAAADKRPWFRKDPRIVERIARDGYLGLGPEIDAAFIERYFE